MAWTDCVAFLGKAAGRDLTDDEVDLLFTELQRRRNYLLAKKLATDTQDAALRAADELSRDIKLASVIERRNAALNLQKRIDRYEWASQVFGTRVAETIETLLVGTNRAVSGAREGVAQIQNALRSHYLQGFVYDLRSADLDRVFAKGNIDQDVARALWAIGKDNEAAVHAGLPKEAVTIARIVNKWQETARIDANREGAWIGKLAGHIVRQSHDPYRIHRAGPEAWKNAARRLFDLDRMSAERPGPAESNALAPSPVGPSPPLGVSGGVSAADRMLDALYVNLASGNHLKAETEPSGGFTGPANLAKRMSQERIIHFKDADAWFEYNQLFGTKNLREAVTAGLSHSAMSIGLMRVLGTNPKSMLKQLTDELTLRAKEAGDIDQLSRLAKRQHKLDNYMAVVDGTANMPANQLGARWAAGVRGIETMGKLGGMIASQLNDLAIYAGAMKMQGRSYFDTMGEAVAGLGKTMQSGERFELLSSLDVTMDSLIGSLGRTGSFNEPGSMARATQLFMKLNLSQWWTEHLRGAAAEGMSHHMALQKAKSWAELSPDYSRTLTTYGITPEDWDVIRTAGAKLVEGKPFVTPDLIEDRAIQNKLRNYFVDRVGFAVVEPDAKTRAMMLGGTKSGTWWGEFVRFTMQFKSFTGAYMQKSMGQELYGRGYMGDSIWGALKNGHGEAWGLARLIGVSTLMGYASLTLKDLMKGRSPRDVTDPQIAWKVFLASAVQGGGAGIYGDFLFGEASRTGGGTLETLAGPTVSTAASFIDLYHRALRGDDVAATGFRNLLNNTPFINLFYSRVVLDYLIMYDLQEQMNPGYLRRMQSRMEKEYGQHLIVEPGR